MSSIDNIDFIISDLKDFLKLTDYESRAYITLLISGPLKISKLSQLAKIPRSKCYTVVKSLMSKGLAYEVSDKPLTVGARDIKEVAYRKLNETYRALEMKADRIVKIVDQVAVARLSDDKEVELAKVSLINTLEDLESSLIIDLANVKKEIIIVTSRSPIKISWRKLIQPIINAVKSGVAIRYYVSEETGIGRHIVNYFKLLKDEPIEGRGVIEIYSGPPIEQPFIIIDDRIVYNLITDPNLETFLFAIKIVNSSYAKHMKIYFTLLKTKSNITKVI